MKLTKTKLKQMIKEELGTELGGTFPNMSEEESLEDFWMNELHPLVENYLLQTNQTRYMPTQFLERMIQFVRDQGY